MSDKLTVEQAQYVANIFSNYFDRFERIDDYIRDQKLNSLSDRPFVLPGMGPEEDLFSDFSVNPMDMDFELVELPQDTWDIYLNMISSHSNMTVFLADVIVLRFSKRIQTSGLVLFVLVLQLSI